MARRRRKLIIRDRKKTALRMAIAIVSLIALIGAAVLAFFLIKSCGVKMSMRQLPIVSGDMVAGTGDGLLYVRGGQLEFLSFRDEDENFTRVLTGAAEPTGVAGTEGIRVVWSSDAVQIVGAQFDMDAGGTIEAVRCGEAHVAVCAEKPNGDELITVFTSAGQQLKVFEFPRGRLVDFGFSETSGSTLWTMELDTDSGAPRTTISTFDLIRMSSTGVITVSGQLVERIFFTSSSVFVVGTESLIRYSASANREIYRVQLYGYRVEDVTLSGEAPLLMLLPRGVSAEEASSVRLLSVSQQDVAGETAVTVILPSETVGCHLTNGSLAVITRESVRLYSAKGSLIDEEQLGRGAVLAAQKLDGRHILLERSGDFVLLTVGK